MEKIKWAFLVIALFIGACSQSEAKIDQNVVTGTSQKSDNQSSKIINKDLLLFFINPNGRPCQIQDSILKEMGPELENKVDIVYIKTTDPAAREVFYKYGIRSLPNLILTDLKGNELNRFPPGIQYKESIRSALTR